MEHEASIDYIIVTTSNKDYINQIYEQAIRIGFCDEKLLFLYDDNVRVVHKQDNGVFYDISVQIAQLHNKIVHSNIPILISAYSSDSGKKELIGKGAFERRDQYLFDYFCFRTFELAAAEIRGRELFGATAELGVFRGVFSRLIHAHFPDKKHYMFDTFEGFDKDEWEKTLERCTPEKREASQIWADRFADTSIDIVMKDMPAPNNCIIRKGYFPDSIKDDERKEKFVFVSLDVDLEELTYQGLKFFVPRMIEGVYFCS